MQRIRSRFLCDAATDDRGAVAITFALLTFVICGAVGMAVDLTRVSAVKSSLQSALDHAVIAVASGRQAGDQDGIERLTAYMSANWKERHGAGPAELTYSEPTSSTLIATAKTIVPTTISNVIGIGSIEVGATTQASFGVGKAEVALALDTTRSMEGPKLDALKTAAEALITDTYARPTATTNIRFSIVPFAQYVNVGTGMRGQSWVNVPNDSSVNTCWMEKPITSKSGCTMRTVTAYDDGKPFTYSYEECSSVTYGPEVQQCGTVQTKWHGCVGSRNPPKDAEVELSSLHPITGIMDIWCANELLRLTNSQSTLQSTIRNLGPAGNTYMAPGIMWGWRTLSPTRPFEDAAPKTGTQRARKVLVLMSDGANTASASYPAHDGGDPAAANAKTAQVCAAAKSDGIEIFAIAFEVTDQTALDLLQGCATSPGTHYFNATDTSKLMAAFRKVGESLTSVRLSR
jgi:Flp pilus assembly protein TadG